MDYFIWNINPIALDMGLLKLNWYTIFFIGSFIVGTFIITKWIFNREHRSLEMLEELLLYSLVGTLIGARLMHCLAYSPQYYLSHPLEILMVWKGGLASHGGMLGVMVALWIIAKKHNESYFWLISRMVMPGFIVAFSVRMGNFFNSEILGKFTDVPWAVIFSRIDMQPRHPVQLYEAFSYLILFTLFVILYRKISSAFATRLFPGLFLFSMFTVRFFLEYTKTKQEDYTWDIPFTTGQMLSIPFIFIGLTWIIWAITTSIEHNKNIQS